MTLTSEQFNRIISEYDSTRFNNHIEYEKRLEEVYSAIPAIKDINDKISSLSVQTARKMLSGEESAIFELNNAIKDLSAEKQSLLLIGGYPADYLEMKYSCSHCKDTGYINNEKCHCLKQKIIDVLYCQSNLGNILSRENFDTFSFNYYPDNVIDPVTQKTPLQNIQEVVDYCHKFINSFDTHYENLLFYGSTGVGKTFLTNCIAKELLEQSHSVIYVSAISMFDIVARYKFNHSYANDSKQLDLEEFKSCDLLIIDDLGTEMINSFTTSALFDFLNERIIARKSTIISTNLSIEELQQNYSERIFSRTAGEFTLLKIFGDDIRIKSNF